MKNIWVICLVFTPILDLFAQDTIIITQPNQIIQIGKQVKYWVDESDKVDIHALLNAPQAYSFIKSRQTTPNFGFFKRVVWLKFVIRNHTKQDIFLKIENTFLDKVNFYNVNPQGKLIFEKEAGFALPFKKRDFKTNTFVFMISKMAEEEFTGYLRVQSRYPLQLPLKISTIQPIVTNIYNDSLLKGIFLGLMILVIFFNLFVYLSLNERLYFNYFIYVLLLFFINTMLEGYTFQYLWADYPSMNDYLPTMTAITYIFGIHFSIGFLNTQEFLKPLFHKILKNLQYLLFLIIGLNILNFDLITVMFLLRAAIFFVIIYLVISSCIVLLRGYKPAIYYLIAWGCFLISAIIYAMQQDGYLPHSYFTSSAALIGASLESLLFTLALINRVRLERNDKLKAQQSTLLALRDKEKLIEEQNKTLEETLSHRTQELLEAHYQSKLAWHQIKQQKEEIEAQKEEIESQSEKIQRINDDLTDSITYAYRIQQAMLASPEEIAKVLPEYFIFYKPRDIVSGDFYYFHFTGEKIILAAADCTGHGVPGAFMSMIGNEILNEIIKNNEITEPEIILKELNIRIRKALRQEENKSQDGMDIALCVIDQRNKTLKFSGAKNPLIYIQNNELFHIKGSIFPIGGEQIILQEAPLYEKNEISLEEPIVFYIYSDGFQDQFGGKNGKKFMIGQFKKLLLEIHSLPIKEQAEILAQTLETWMDESNQSQVDDILVIGVKIK